MALLGAVAAIAMSLPLLVQADWTPQKNNYSLESARLVVVDSGAFFVPFLNFAPVKISEVPDWTLDPYGDPSWRLYYQSLVWVYSFLAEFDDGSNVDALNRGLGIVVSWIDSHPAVDSNLPAWYDHAVVYRSALLVHLLAVYSPHLTYEAEQKIVSALNLHASALLDLFADPTFDANNHGSFHAMALINLALFGQQAGYVMGGGQGDWLSQGLRRWDEVLPNLVSVKDGVSREQAGAYQLNVPIDILREAIVLFGNYGFVERVQQLEELRLKMSDFAAVVTKPTMTMVAYGDTHAGWDPVPTMRYAFPSQGPLLRHLLSGGLDGLPAASPIFVYRDAGYVVFNEALYQSRPSRSSAFLFFDTTSPAFSHGHHDALSLVFSHDGVDWLVDSGGPFRYGAGKMRYMRRSMHPAPVFAGDLVGGTGIPEILGVSWQNDTFKAAAKNDQRGSIQIRSVKWEKVEEYLVVDDVVETTEELVGEWLTVYLPLAPRVEATVFSDHIVLQADAARRELRWAGLNSDVRVSTEHGGDTGWRATAFGVEEPATTIKLSMRVAETRSLIRWGLRPVQLEGIIGDTDGDGVGDWMDDYPTDASAAFDVDGDGVRFEMDLRLFSRGQAVIPLIDWFATLVLAGLVLSIGFAASCTRQSSWSVD